MKDDFKLQSMFERIHADHAKKDNTALLNNFLKNIGVDHLHAPQAGHKEKNYVA